MHKKWLKYIILAVLILTIISVVLCIWLPFWQSFRIIFGVVYLLFLPGFIWSWVFWKSNEIDIMERGILSIGLSMIFVPLLVFLLNKIGVKINLTNLILEIGALIISATFINIFSNKNTNNLIKRNE